MSKLAEAARQAWNEKSGPVILSTVNTRGEANSIYATCNALFEDEYILIADNFFSKTKENILAGSKGAVLYITADNKSFQIKGSIEYQTEGKFFDNMKEWNPENLPGHAVAAIKVEEVYSGAEKIQ